MTGAKVALKAKKKYLFICEGACTEPDYINGIETNARDLGVESIISLSAIPKLKMDCNETDVERLIKIARDYVQYCRSEGRDCSRRLVVTLIFENAYSELCESKKFDAIKTDNKELREIRSKIDGRLDEKGIPSDRPLTKEETAEACRICKDVFSELFKIEIAKVLKPNRLKIEPILDGDVVCIIHDRDYSRYFKDTEYLNACKKVKRLSKGPIEYKLVITYPKFEFWMLLHSTKLDVSKLKIGDLRDYSKIPGPSKNVDELMDKNLPGVLIGPNKKSISPTKFDSELCPNIRLAIENSKNPVLSTDLFNLCKNPGTLMGPLMEEILPKK